MEKKANTGHKTPNTATPLIEWCNFGWKWLAKWTGFGLLIAIFLTSIFLISFPSARSYFSLYLKHITIFLGANTGNNHQKHAQQPLSPDAFSVHGIDVSHHNMVVNWDLVNQITGSHDSISFVFIKATEGGNHIDTRFKYNWEFSKKNHLLRGAYHYFKPKVDPIRQAEWFIENVTLQKGDLPPVIDVEESHFYFGYTIEDEVFKMAKVLETYYQVKPIIYTSHNFYELYFDGERFEQFPFWIARYNFHHRLSTLGFWEFWQHSESGSVNGINGEVDVNVFAGTISDLQKLTIGYK